MLSSSLIIQALVVFVGAVFLTMAVRSAAIRYRFFDNIDDRKVHKVPIPRVGGLAIFISFIIPVLMFADLDTPSIALIVAALVLFLMGLLDDLRGLNAYIKLAVQIVAAMIVLAGGIGIVSISLPFIPGLIDLDSWRIPIHLFGSEYNIIPFANLFTIFWIVLIINAVNLLDGLDGLAAGVASIAFLTLLALAGQGFGNEIVVLMSTFMIMSISGFLVSNFFPARIFMGDSGAYLIGLLLAVLPMYATTKTTIGLLVIGLAVIDLLLAVFRRLVKGNSPFSADRGHLHHRLLDKGVKHVNVVLLFYLVAAVTAMALLAFNLLAAAVVLLVATILIMLSSKATKII